MGMRTYMSSKLGACNIRLARAEHRNGRQIRAYYELLLAATGGFEPAAATNNILSIVANIRHDRKRSSGDMHSGTGRLVKNQLRKRVRRMGRLNELLRG